MWSGSKSGPACFQCGSEALHFFWKFYDEMSPSIRCYSIGVLAKNKMKKYSRNVVFHFMNDASYLLYSCWSEILSYKRSTLSQSIIPSLSDNKFFGTVLHHTWKSWWSAMVSATLVKFTQNLKENLLKILRKFTQISGYLLKFGGNLLRIFRS